MTRPQDLLNSKYTDAVTLLFVLLFGLGMSFAAYIGHRTNTIDAGSFGVGPYLSNFYADEADVDYRYRWTKGSSDVQFTGAGSATPKQVQLRAQAPPLSVFSGTITVTLSINGIILEPAIITPSRQLQTYSFDLALYDPVTSTLHAPYIVSIASTTFRPPGDPRTLGIKVDSVTLAQSSTGPNTPPLDVTAWWLIFLTGLTLVLTPLRQWLRLALTIALAVFAAIFFFSNVLFAGAYLPPVAVIVALAGLVAWQRHRLPRWPFALDLAGTRPRPAALAMLIIMLIFAGISLWAIPQVAWVGHADYAENANIARNFVEGRGLSVDYVAQFYKSYPGITHPAETWPLLQPIMIAPFFALFGPETWASKLPNLFILLALAWGVFALASRLWDARAGLFAGLLTLFHPYFFNTVLYPINDLVFTAIFFALAWLVWHSLECGMRNAECGIPTGDHQEAIARRSPPHSAFRIPHSAFIGILSALLIWSKPSGAPLLVGLGLWALVVWWHDRKEEKAASPFPFRFIAVLALAFVVVLLPLLVRNLLSLGSLYFSTEGLDAWILRYWPYIDWENIYRVYVGVPDYPHPRWIVGGKFGYQNLVDAVGINFRWVWERGVMGGITNSDFIIAPIPLAGALFGLAVLSKRVAGLFVMVLLSLVLYSLFVLLYWHFEGRYFQVAVPWLYMLLAWGVVWFWDRVRALVPAGKSQWAAWSVPLLALAAFLWPALDQMHNHLVYDTRPTSFTVAMDWLNQNSSPGDVVMTRDPWELNWYTQRKAVMIPFEDLATIMQVARQYGVTMLQIGGSGDSPNNFDSCPKDPNAARFPTGARPALGKLYCGFDMPGFTRVYQNNDLIIYRLTQ